MRRFARPALFWAGVALSGVFTYFALRGVRYGELWGALKDSNGWWLVAAFGLLVVAVFVRVLRWSYLFSRETRPPLGPLASALLLGYFFNNVLPLRAGEAARVVALRQRYGISAAESAGTVVIERAYDVLYLLILFFVALPWIPDVSWTGEAAVLAGVVAAALFAGAVVVIRFGERPVEWALRPLAFLPFLSSERIANAARNGVQGLVALRRPRLALAAFFWTSISWVTLACSFWFVMLAFHLGLSPLAGLLVAVATGVALIVPSTPGAIGVFEGATVIALGAYGIARTPALSYAIALHALNLIPFLVAGYVVLHREGAGLRRALPEQ